MSTSSSKKTIDKFVYSVIGLCFVVLLLGLVAMMPGANGFLEAIFGSKQIESVDFSSLQPSEEYDHYLACPPDVCMEGVVDEFSEAFNIPATQLRSRLMSYVDSRPGINLRDIDMDLGQFEFSEDSISGGFPDIVTVRIFALGDNQSTLAIYSQSIFNNNQTDANKTRVIRWLNMVRPTN